MFPAFLLAQLIACAAMTGIIWMVQLAIYPLFARLEGATFDDYHQRYMKQVSFVIAPFMCLEATTCAACLYLGDWRSQAVPTALLAVVWASTAFIQVPQHQKLTPETVPALVRSNWLRTIVWTARLALLGVLVFGLTR